MFIPPKFVFLHFSKAGGTFTYEVGYERVKADSLKLRTRRSACVGARTVESQRSQSTVN